jgi:hypothetical protein
MLAVHQALGARVVRELPIVTGLQLVEIADGQTLAAALRFYRTNPHVLYAEPDYIVHASTAPNDPKFSQQWSLQNTGQSGGTSGADIKAVQAWALSTGSSNVVVGVIDTGIDYNHQDLAANVFVAPNGFAAMSANGVVVQCPSGTHGFNMVANSCDPLDDNGHGSHVSGTIGAVGNNNLGVTGINWNVRLLSCKFLDATGAGATSAAIGCLNLMQELKDSGINIVATNNSWGGSDSSQALHDAIAAAMLDGMLFVAAAGNDFSNNDDFPTYPANFGLPNIISVAATDRNDAMPTFSNFGRRTVHIGAPGRDILSTTPNNTYSLDTGTSMATPHVTGVAALLKAQNPALDWRAIKNLILSGGDTIPALQSTITGKRLDAFGAMTCMNNAAAARLLPVADDVSASVGTPLRLSALNINCAQPAGNVTVHVSPGNQSVILADDGGGGDIAAGDGIYTGSWTPAATGNYSLAFPDGSSVSVQVLAEYGVAQTAYNYQTISGTNLNLGDDSVALLTAPFPIPFGGGSFSQLYVSSNGTISFTAPFVSFQNYSLAPNAFPDTVSFPTTLIAPWWQDLYPQKGTSQNVFWAVTGTAPNRNLVVEWRNLRAFECRSDSSGGITFQVVFKEGSSDVLFNYSDVILGGACSDLDYGQNGSTGLLVSQMGGVMWGDDYGPNLNAGLALLWQSPPPTGANSPAPALSKISPSSAAIFSPDVTVTLTGTNFVPTSIVQWANTNVAPEAPGNNLPTKYISSTQLTAVIPSEFFAPFSRYVVGTVQALQVNNPAPGGGISNPLTFSIVFPTPPAIASISPQSASAGDFSLLLDVKGSNLYNAVIAWNGTNLQTFQVSNTEVQAAVPSTLLILAGTAKITAVVTTATGMVSSAAVTFTINPATGAMVAAPGLARHESVDSNGATKPATPLRRPTKFLGWKLASKLGPEYSQRYSRSYAGPAISRGKVSGAPAEYPRPQANSAVGLGQPSSLPGFAFHSTMPAGYLPTSVTTGDFNRDGKMDWAVSNAGSSDIWVYFGNGDGTAQLPTIIPLSGAAPLQVVAVDLRKVGILDLVVAETDSQSIGILLGKGDGTFQPEVSYYVPGPPLSIAIADVNKDGNLDIVAGTAGDPMQGPMATFLGDGTGKFGSPITSQAYGQLASFLSTQIVLKDINGDGLPDAIIVDEGPSVAGAHSYINNGDGTFKHADNFFVSADFIFITSVAVADMDGDGCPDAVTGEALGVVRIFKGTCDGSFVGFPNVASFGAGEAPVSVALADMNGDGHLDVVTGGGFFGVAPGLGQEATNLVTVLLGDGSGNLSSPQVYRGEPSLYGLAVVDLSGDGKPEVIAASQDTDTIVVFKNDGKGNLDGPVGGYLGYIAGGQSGTSNAPLSSLVVQDVNGDGKPDIAVLEAEPTASSAFEFAVLVNDGTGHFAQAVRSPVSDYGDPPTGFALGDFRNTGRMDLILWEQSYQGTGAADLAFFPNTSGASFGRGTITALSQLTGSGGVLTPGDFNKDGNLDFVLANSVAPNSGSFVSELVFFKGNGDGTFQAGPPMQFGSNTPPRMVFTGDFNHDGKLDVLVWVYDNIVGVQNHHVYEFLGNGDGTFAEAKLILPNFGFFGMADLNHDDLPDIVEFNQTPTTINSALDQPVFTVYLGQSDGTFKQGQTYSSYAGTVYPGYGFSNVGPSQILSPMLADFNGDGNTDIGVVMQGATYPLGGSYLQILAGNGDGTFTPTYEIAPFDKFAFPLNAADVNGDGRADLIELDGWPSSFHVIPGVVGPTVQLTMPTRPIVGTKGSVNVNLSLLSVSATTVQLVSSDPGVTIPASISVPPNTLTLNVPFGISPAFNSSKVFSITAQLNGQSSTVYAYQASAALSGVTVFSDSTRMSTPPGGTTPDYVVGVTSIGGYTSTMQLSCQGLPKGATCNFGTNPLPVSPGQSVGSSLTIQTSLTTPLGSYSIKFVASDGSVASQLSLTLNVSDFSIALNPTAVSVLPGKPANFTLVLGSSTGWNDLISVNCSIAGPGNPSCDAGGTYNVGSFPFTIDTNNFSGGDYTVTTVGSADGISHTATTTTIHVQGVAIALTPTLATVSVGGTANFNISLTSQGGYSDQFTFSCQQLPPGLACNFSPPSGSVTAGGTLTSMLAVSVTSKPATVGAVRSFRFRRWPSIATFTCLLSLCALGLLAFWNAGVWVPDRKLASGLFAAATLLLVAVTFVACGGGGSSSPPPPPPPPPPSSVTVTFTVQASSPTLSISVGTIKLTVD